MPSTKFHIDGECLLLLRGNSWQQMPMAGLQARRAGWKKVMQPERPIVWCKPIGHGDLIVARFDEPQVELLALDISTAEEFSIYQDESPICIAAVSYANRQMIAGYELGNFLNDQLLESDRLWT